MSLGSGLKTARRLLGGRARETKGAIAVHHTAVDTDSAWDAGEALKNLGDEPTVAQLKALHAWYDEDQDSNLKGAYKLPHHNVSSQGKVGAANMKGCASAMGRLNGGGLDIPSADRKGVYSHLKVHYDDADMEAPDLKSSFAASKSRLRMEIKEITAEGAFEGMLSPYGNVDEGGDVVEAGAYAKTLADHGSKVPLLWQHKPDCPVGELTLEDRKTGLWCKGQLLMALPEAQKAYLLIKSKIVKGLSIGFESVKDAIEDGVRKLKEIRLYEGSIVTFPMNEMALISSVKGHREGKGDFNEELSENQILNSYWQMQSALGNALTSAIWSDLSRDEKVAAANTVLQQFSDAFSAFLPAYLDAIDEAYGETWARNNLETKSGAMISASNADKIKSACQKIKSGHDELMALLENDKAGMATLSTKAAMRTEPAEDHSAAENLSEAEMIDHLRSLIPA